MESWQFEYRTNAVWDKQMIGMGYWFRGQHELLLVGVRGDVPRPEESTRVSSVIASKRTQHSEKPIQVYEIIEAMYPQFTKRHRCELFARAERKGWSCWGNEVKA